MLGGLQRSLDQDPLRAESAVRSRGEAEALTARFSLVHRSVGPHGPRLSEIFAEKRLIATRPCTPREAGCGIDRVVYFFLGCGAYPEGAVAFLANAAVLRVKTATFTPFDTGSLEKYARPRDDAWAWEAADKDAFLRGHLGFGPAALSFSSEYLAAHFKVPSDYVCRPQTSEPDFPAYHGLVNRVGDRRAWSIEVQLHGDLVLDRQSLAAIVLAQPDLLADVPDDLVEKVVVAEDEGSITPVIHRLIIGEQGS